MVCLPWLRPIKTKSVALSCPIGRSHGELGRSTDEMRCDEGYEHSLHINEPQRRRRRTTERQWSVVSGQSAECMSTQ